MMFFWNRRSKRRALVSALFWICLLIAPLLLTRTGAADEGTPVSTDHFRQVAPQGFGDPDNNVAWAMQWWRGQLYVGTNRSWGCWSQLALHVYLNFPYPPPDGEMGCPDDPADLALQAEIWRYTPETARWERVYQSPLRVPVPGSDRHTTREVGYRGMGIFQEADGTEALYVGTVYPKAINPDGYVPPRILRSEDGEHFEELPQDPGTMLGDYGRPSFRSLLDYNDKLYVIAASIYGSGAVWEAAHPELGNDAFQEVTPAGMSVFEMIPYNGQLYVGTTDEQLLATGQGDGYEVLRASTGGDPPYHFTPVVTHSGGLQPPSRSVASMAEFGGQLYVGTDSPAELISIYPDDSWDIVVGDPRTVDGETKGPRSGYRAGFDWPYNVHIWRMQSHDGMLFIGTADDTYKALRNFPQFAWQFGFDLWVTDDGWYFYPVTIDGFGDPQQWGVRNFASTPHGLFMGTGSFWSGLQIWQMPGYRLFLPVVQSAGSAGVATMATAQPGPATSISPIRRLDPARPTRLELEQSPEGWILSWDNVTPGSRYHVYRSRLQPNSELQLPDLALDAWVPGPPEEIAITGSPFYVDRAADPLARYQYHVRAGTAAAILSQRSNLVSAPPQSAPITLSEAARLLQEWTTHGVATSEAGLTIASMREQARNGNFHHARALGKRLRERLASRQVVQPWRIRDAEIILDKLDRRLQLLEQRLITTQSLDGAS
jgi:hypothetical protein